MLPKSKRLTTEEFKEVFENGKKIYSPLFMYSYVIKESFKLSVVASKKNFKKAVQRNKYKRKIFNIVRSFDKDTLPNAWIICTFKKEAIDKDNTLLEKDIRDTLGKI